MDFESVGINLLHFWQKTGEEASEEGADLRPPVGSVGLAAQLQALRTTLQQKYVQEVAALKEQHSRELRRVQEEKELDRERQKEKDLNDIYSSGRSGEGGTAAGQDVQGKKQDWERIEEEVAKVGVRSLCFYTQVCCAIDGPSEKIRSTSKQK